MGLQEGQAQRNEVAPVLPSQVGWRTVGPTASCGAPLGQKGRGRQSVEVRTAWRREGAARGWPGVAEVRNRGGGEGSAWVCQEPHSPGARTSPLKPQGTAPGRLTEGSLVYTAICEAFRQFVCPVAKQPLLITIET